MKATIQSWKLWNEKEEYPVLCLHASADEIEETKALYRLQQICKGLRGLGYQRTLAAVNNPESFKDQGTSFVIDLGTLLTLLAEVELDAAKRTFAVGWLAKLTPVIKAQEQKQEDPDKLVCRCGQTFKNDKHLQKHKKLCSVLSRDFGLLLRAENSLKALSGKIEKKGKGHGRKAKEGSKLGRKDHEAHELQPKVPARQKRKPKRKKVRGRR